MKITLKWLEDEKACQPAVDWFVAASLDGIDLLKLIQKRDAAGDAVRDATGAAGDAAWANENRLLCAAIRVEIKKMSFKKLGVRPK